LLSIGLEIEFAQGFIKESVIRTAAELTKTPRHLTNYPSATGWFADRAG
jgi:hypothetical protein